LPWSVVALWTLHPGFVRLWDERGRRLLQALHCWTWPNMLFWSLIAEHAPRHSFPLFPGLAGLAAMVWLAWLTGRLPWRLPRVTPAQFLVGAVILWLVAKLVLVEVVIPGRNQSREPREKGQLLAEHVPAGATLYLFRLKDEGIMFYFGRLRPLGLAGPPVLRLDNPGELPSSAEPMYCILDEREWRQWGEGRPAEAILHLTDEQGAPIVLVRVMG
jgi:hypothetical protein